MLLAMVLLVACGNGKDKKSADDDEDETEIRTEIEDDNDFDVDDIGEEDFDVEDIDEDDIDEEEEEAASSVLSVSSLFDVLYMTLANEDLEYCAEQLLAKGLTFDGEKHVEGLETYMRFSHPDYGEFYVGVSNELPALHINYYAGDVSEEEFFKVARSRGFREVESGNFSDGNCTIKWTVDGFIMSSD